CATAFSWGPPSRATGYQPAEPLLELQLPQLRPARVRGALVAMLGPGLVQVRRAHWTQPAAIVATEHLHRRGQRERVAHPRGQVQRLVCDVRAFQVPPFARSVNLASLDLEGRPSDAEAAHA